MTVDPELDAYLGSRIDQAVVERYLERSIGRMIDLNYHLITGRGHPPPSDYHASFVRLGELGVLGPAFARSIARAAGLRNRLVHEYEEIDPAKVFAALLDARRDVPAYLEQARASLAQ
jgi:uncharacterized protein YutE (UPF0331/DUF86 family)